MYRIDVAECYRDDGKIMGGFSIYCETEEELNQVVSELEEEIADEKLTDTFPCHSLKWRISEVDEVEHE